MRNTMTPNQLELSFQAQVIPASSARTPSRSEWWFSQMRRVVDLAMEWKPTPTGRPEQSYLELRTRRA